MKMRNVKYPIMRSERSSLFLENIQSVRTRSHDISVIKFLIFGLLIFSCLSLENASAKGVIMLVSQGWHKADKAKVLEYSSVNQFNAVWNVVDTGGRSHRIPAGLIIANITLPTDADFQNIESSSDVYSIQNKLDKIKAFGVKYPQSSGKLAPTINLLDGLLAKTSNQVRVNGVWMSKQARAVQLEEQKKKEEQEEKVRKERAKEIAEQKAKAQEDKPRRDEEAKKSQRAKSAPSLEFKGFSLNMSYNELKRNIEKRFGSMGEITSEDGIEEMVDPNESRTRKLPYTRFFVNERLACIATWQSNAGRKYMVQLALHPPYAAKLFNAEGLDFDNFVQRFINEYGIKVIDTEKKKVNYTTSYIARHRSDDGWELIISNKDFVHYWIFLVRKKSVHSTTFGD